MCTNKLSHPSIDPVDKDKLLITDTTKMSKFYEILSVRSSSESLTEEPLICFNTDCNYPYGKICGDCMRELEVRAGRAGKANARSHSEAAGKVEVPPPQVKSDVASVRNRSHDIETRIADIMEDLQAIFPFVPVTTPETASAKPEEKVKEKEPEKETIPTPPHPLSLHNWLTEILHRTCDDDGVLAEPLFTGGADEEDRMENCPFCGGSMDLQGAYRDLHLMQCGYAHEEVGRLERAKIAWRREKAMASLNASAR
ncbi:hypothetical protein NHQ30_005874 [Ciborinia camelliae]|nr:hypothetical protein NHQ30_005874 [Ciborinia camelliae]